MLGKTLEVEWQGKKYVFVASRKKSIEMEEALEYLAEQEPKKEVETSWRIPEDRVRVRLFLDEIRQHGIGFAASKYGVSEREVQVELKRLVPHRNLPNGS